MQPKQKENDEFAGLRRAEVQSPISEIEIAFHLPCCTPF